MDIDKSRWPDNVPHCPEDLEKAWGAEIDKWVGKYNKVRANQEDLRQVVRTVIYKPDFCLRYVQALERSPSLPETMTTEESLAYMGVCHPTWVARHQRYEKGKIEWMPDPVTGGRYGMNSTWRSDDIVKLVMDSVFDTERERKLPKLKSTNANFAGYLRRAVHNAVCNFIRTKSRKEKERPFDHFWIFRNKVAYMDEPVPFEELLVHEHHGDDPDVRANLSIAVGRIAKAVPNHKDNIMKSLVDGYTLQEAIDRLDAPKHVKVVVRRTLGRALQINIA
jgi:DNA-directed RNA polymerase specialized sigma24 family protein